MEVRTPSWPLFVGNEEYNNDTLNQQKIAIEKHLQEIFEKESEPDHIKVFKCSEERSPSHITHLFTSILPTSGSISPETRSRSSSLRKTKSAENSPPLMTYFTRKNKISP